MAKLKGMFNGFWRYRYLLWNLVSRDFKLKYRRSVLGVLWIGQTESHALVVEKFEDVEHLKEVGMRS